MGACLSRPGRWAILLTLLAPATASAVQLEALEAGRDWRVRRIEFQGNRAVPVGKLREAMVTKERPWHRAWQFWKPLPPLDPVAFRADLDRLRQLCRNEGYYEARISHDIQLPEKGQAVTLVIVIDEGRPVYVASVSVSLEGEPLGSTARETLLTSLPLRRGDVFTEAAYVRAFSMLRAYYREHGFARVKTTRKAAVDVPRGAADVTFRVESGPACVFGEARVSGTKQVDPEVVRQEIAFEPGQPFRASLLEKTRSNLVGLKIFRSVRVTEDEEGNDRAVDIRVRVAEGPTHEVRVGAGYDTEEQIRGLASWRDYNFFGDARQLGFTARASFLRRTLAADFLQPHFPGRNDRVRLIAFEQQEDEDTYNNDRARVSPRIEWAALPNVTPYAVYRIEYDSLSNVHSVVKAALPELAPSNVLLSGLGLGVDVNLADDLLDPTRGWLVSASVEPVTALRGDFSFVRAVVEGRRFQPLPEQFLAAFRLRLGTEELIAGEEDVPLYERFYAGGLNSVRGYGRRRAALPVQLLRPPGVRGAFVADRDPRHTRVDDEPVGGRSLIEGSAEIRHPITEKLGAALFLDAGGVSRDSHDFPFDDLLYGTGVGAYYKSAIGPLRLDLGFPINKPPGEPGWQVHVSIGQTF